MVVQRSSNTFIVEVDGRELPDALQLALIDATVEDELNLPDMCELVFRDQLRSAVASGRFELGAELTIKVVSEATPAGTLIFEGEITALEAEIERDGAMTIVRGLDLLHRLQRGTHTETYLDMTYGDIIAKVGQRHGLGADDRSDNTVVHDAVVQWNRTDWEFVSELAAAIGCEVVIEDGALVTRRPDTADGAPEEGDIESDDARKFVVGGNILQLRSTISGGEQVRDVTVRGWDPTTKEPVEGTVAAGGSADSVAVGIGADRAAERLDGGELVVAERPVSSAEVAADRAASLGQQLGSAVAELEGVVFGNPELRAGTSVSLAGLGAPFDGKYVLTSCRHTYAPGVGYRTGIRVSGRQRRTMLGAIIGSGATGRQGHQILGGVMPAVVSDVDDPERQGRVKVAFPWLGERATSHWARVTAPGAGPERGLMVLPEVDDEVLVAFEQGDPRHPFVLGGLWNGKDDPPFRAVDERKVVSRGIVTRTGHRIELHDGDDTITIVTADESHQMVLDASGKKISIESRGDVEVSSETISLTSTGELKLKGTGVSIDAGAGDFEAKGTSLKLSGTAEATLDGGATTTVRGGLVKIN